MTATTGMISKDHNSLLKRSCAGISNFAVGDGTPILDYVGSESTPANDANVIEPKTNPRASRFPVAAYDIDRNRNAMARSTARPPRRR